MIVSTKDATLANGTPNQVLSIIGIDQTGTTTITPATSTGWLCIYGCQWRNVNVIVYRQYVCWIVAGYSGTTITGKNSGT